MTMGTENEKADCPCNGKTTVEANFIILTAFNGVFIALFFPGVACVVAKRRAAITQQRHGRGDSQQSNARSAGELIRT